MRVKVARLTLEPRKLHERPGVWQAIKVRCLRKYARRIWQEARLWLPALQPGTTTGGGGGTVHPRLSPQPGLCLHPFAQKANGCGACYPTDKPVRILVPAQACAVGESMSLYR